MGVYLAAGRLPGLRGRPAVRWRSGRVARADTALIAGIAALVAGVLLGYRALTPDSFQLGAGLLQRLLKWCLPLAGLAFVAGNAVTWDPRNPENRERTRRLQRELRAHLMRWDPIGVGEAAQAQSEYDGYINPLLHMLHAGESEDAVTTYLARLVEDRIALRSHPEREQQFAATLVSWWSDTTSK